MIQNDIFVALFSEFCQGTENQGLTESKNVFYSLPFKDQVAANAVRKQLHDFSHKIGPILQPVFVSKKLGQDLKPKEIKPSIVNK